MIKIKKRWEIPESEVTPESLYRQRRNFIKSAGVMGGALLLNPFAGAQASYAVDGYQQNALSLDEEITDEEDATSYKPGTYSLEDLIRPHALEERIYRLRCVEAWSMVIPWIGVPLGSILKTMQPTSAAKYVAFRTLHDPLRMPGQQRSVVPWPYREGLTMAEAMHPLTLVSVGMYGKTMPNQNGAPIRLVVPWKYGFKSIKSIVNIEFVEDEPKTSWNMILPNEYGFYSNVNPEVDHPRWTQKKERRIGDIFKRETLMFNGYEEEVAGLYDDLDLKVNF